MIDSRLHVGTPRHDTQRGAPEGDAFQSFHRPASPLFRAFVIGGFAFALFVVACIGAAMRAG